MQWEAKCEYLVRRAWWKTPTTVRQWRSFSARNERLACVLVVGEGPINGGAFYINMELRQSECRQRRSLTSLPDALR